MGNNRKLQLAVRAALAASAATGFVPTALAQTAPAVAAASEAAANNETALQEVVVTGSRISVPNQVSISPVTFVSALDVQQSGVTRVEDLLNSLPQVFANQGSNISNGSTGAATVNLRGLNDKRTLVLVNGFRLGPGDPADPASDINMIPVELIDSIEILTGGASSVYGADAVAGVVNFKINDHFEGVKLVADAGIYQHHNDNPDGVQQAIATSGFQEAPSSVWTGGQKSLAFIAGMNSADGNGNATVYATYRNIGSVLQSKYDYSACTLGSGFIGGPSANGGQFNCAGSSTSYPGRFTSVAINGVSVPKSQQILNTLGPNGTLVPFTAADEYNFGALNYYQRPDERYSAGAFLHYEFNEHATVYANLMFMDDKSVAQIAPSGIFVDTRTFNCSNPFLSTDELNAWCGGNTANTTTLLIGRRNVEGGPRDQIQEHEDFHEVLGVKGKINDVWDYDASFQYSSVLSPIINADYFDKSKEANALNVIGTAANPVCVVGPPCVPYNIFNLNQPPSQASIDYLESNATNQGAVHQTVVNVNLTGDLAKYGVQSPLASSGLKVNIGGEYRDVTVAQLTDAFEQSDNVDGAGGPAPSVVGGVISREGFLEARMPLIEDKPLVQSLDVETGYRYSSYNLGFSTNTYKFGVDWSPVHDVRLRGSFARAVRAPNVVELFTPSTIAIDGTYNTDPCAGAHPVASLAACERSGVTPAQYGNIQVNSAGQYNGYSGGNTSLKAETALTTSFGIGWTPSFVPGFRAQIDYYNIKIEGVIQALGGSNVLQQCLQNGVLCGNIHRDQFGSLWIINDGTLANSGYVVDPLVNNGSLQERGVDLDLSYAFDIGSLGKVRTALVGTYINSYEVEPIANTPSSAYQCVGYYGATCSSATTGAGLPVFRWRHTLRSTWSTPWSGLDVSLAWRYFSGAKTEQFSGNPNIGAIGGTIANGAISNTDAFISSVSYIDLTAAVKLADKVTLRLGVNNVFDKDPPIIGASTLPGPPSGNGNTFPQAYDALGRFFFGQIIAQF
jgi:iron complex outermembrane recepter protein